MTGALLDDELVRWRRRTLLRAAVALVLLLAVTGLVADDHPIVLAAAVPLAGALWFALRLSTRTASTFIPAPRSAVLPVLQKTNHGATDTVEDGLLVHSARLGRPPVHVRSTGDGVLLTTTRHHLRRLRRLL